MADVDWGGESESEVIDRLRERIADLEGQLKARSATVPSDRQDALYDSAYVAGAKAGHNAAQSDDPEALNKLIATRSGYLKVLAAPVVPPEERPPINTERNTSPVAMQLDNDLGVVQELIDEAVEAERAACEQIAFDHNNRPGEEIAKLIRARGQCMNLGEKP